MTKTILNRNDLAKAMTEKTAEYMARGYIIDIDHNKGHQGEVSKVILEKGNRYVAIYLEKERVDLFEDGWREYHATVLTVEVQRDVQRGSSYWLGEGEILEAITFYHVKGFDSEKYTTDKNLARCIKIKQSDRRAARRTEARGFKATSRILKVTKNHWGYKGIKLEDIDYIERKDKTVGFRSEKTKPVYTIYFKNWKKSPIAIS